VLINFNLTRWFYSYRLQFCKKYKLLALGKRLSCGLQLCIQLAYSIQHPASVVS